MKIYCNPTLHSPAIEVTAQGVPPTVPLRGRDKRSHVPCAKRDGWRHALSRDFNRRGKLWLLSLGLGALATGGCGEQGLATTEIKADGTWTRTLKFTSNAALEDQRAAKLEDIFTLPTGAQWATTRSTTKQAITYTARRQLKAGENLSGDIALKLDHTTGLSNRVSVQEVAPGQWQYREVLHFTGPSSSASDFKALNNPNTPENLATLHTLRQTLPPALASHDNLIDLLHTYNQAALTLLFGPPTPLIAELVGHPDLGELELKQRFGTIVSDKLPSEIWQPTDGCSTPDRDTPDYELHARHGKNHSRKQNESASPI